MIRDPIVDTIATYDEIADFYANSMDVFTPIDDRKMFLSYLSPKSRILDVGSAAGRDSIFFSAQGHITVGVDLSQKLLAIARKKAPSLIFLHDDIRKKMFPDGSFDAVWACAVLLHQRRVEIPSILKNFYDVLARDGMLYIRVKEGEGEAGVKEKLSKNKQRHFTYFRLDELKNIVKSAGFDIQKAFRSNEKVINAQLRDIWWITIIARKTS